MIADVRPAGWHSGPDCHWESWSRNGEVCIVGLDPPFTGGARLASCLTWLLRSFARHSRLRGQRATPVRGQGRRQVPWPTRLVLVIIGETLT